MPRRNNIQTISWFWDLYQRDLLDLDPHYQRRSIWNQKFKDYFIETILLQFPCPAIFLYEEISPEGRFIYNVVDGKQRLSTVFEFLYNEFPVSENSQITNLRGFYFKNLEDQEKKNFFSYTFLVEYLPETNEEILNNIFDRINRNVAKLTPQELRHARLDGEFISVVEELSTVMNEELPKGVPRFNKQAKKQMKDDEFVATLLFFIEEGTRGYSQMELEKAFTERDISWDCRSKAEGEFRNIIPLIKNLFIHNNNLLSRSRMHNQADFYSLFGALIELNRLNKIPDIPLMVERIMAFINEVESNNPEKSDIVNDYYQAVRSASNDKGPREKRINIMKTVLLGEV